MQKNKHNKKQQQMNEYGKQLMKGRETDKTKENTYNDALFVSAH